MSKSDTSQQDNAIQNAVLASAYHAEVSRRGLIKALFAAAGAAVLFGSPIRALAADATEETKQALSAAQAEFDKVQAQMNEISAQFTSLSKQLDETLGKIEGVQKQIDETQEKIDEKQKALGKRQDVLSERVADSYKAGGNDALALLLSSTSFDELLSNTYYINKVNERDRRDIEEIIAIRRELEEQKAELEGQKVELEELKETQAAQLEQMKAKKAEVQTLLSGLSTEVQELVAKRDAEILAAVQAEEAARKAAEQAAANRPSAGGPNPDTGPIVTGSSSLDRVLRACNSTPCPGANYCARWVSLVFQNAGIGYLGGNADDMYAAHCTTSNRNSLMPGMIIAVPTYSKNWAGQMYGHVGIYVGNNIVMENIGYIARTNLDTWLNYYGDTVSPRWGWARGIALS